MNETLVRVRTGFDRARFTQRPITSLRFAFRAGWVIAKVVRLSFFAEGTDLLSLAAGADKDLAATRRS